MKIIISENPTIQIFTGKLFQDGFQYLFTLTIDASKSDVIINFEGENPKNIDDVTKEIMNMHGIKNFEKSNN